MWQNLTNFLFRFFFESSDLFTEELTFYRSGSSFLRVMNYSYIGLADFFQEKIKICSRSILTFRCLASRGYR